MKQKRLSIDTIPLVDCHERPGGKHLHDDHVWAWLAHLRATDRAAYEARVLDVSRQIVNPDIAMNVQVVRIL